MRPPQPPNMYFAKKSMRKVERSMKRVARNLERMGRRLERQHERRFEHGGRPQHRNSRSRSWDDRYNSRSGWNGGSSYHSSRSNAWSKKEEALRSRYVKSLENLSEHTRLLPPLNCGDHVMIQNQAGNFPNKWGKSGIIVELKDYHQYVDKIDG